MDDKNDHQVVLKSRISHHLQHEAKSPCTAKINLWLQLLRFGFTWPNNGLYPAYTEHWHNIGLMLVQRRRRWPNVKPALFQRVVFDRYTIEVYLSMVDLSVPTSLERWCDQWNDANTGYSSGNIRALPRQVNKLFRRYLVIDEKTPKQLSLLMSYGLIGRYNSEHIPASVLVLTIIMGMPAEGGISDWAVNSLRIIEKSVFCRVANPVWYCTNNPY